MANQRTKPACLRMLTEVQLVPLLYVPIQTKDILRSGRMNWNQLQQIITLQTLWDMFHFLYIYIYLIK